MRRVYVLDTTLRDGEQSLDTTLDVDQKLELAHYIASLGVDVLEAGFPASSPGDFKAVQTISRKVKGVTVCGLARCTQRDIDTCLEALKPAENSRINLGIAVSPIHMDKKLRLTPDQVVEKAVGAVKHAKKSIKQVQFYAEDAMRSNPTFLTEIYEKVIEAGASVITISDTVGCAAPWTMERLIFYVKTSVRNIEEAKLSIHCHNDLGMATANSIVGIMTGAEQVECTVNGIGERAGNASLEEIVMAITSQQEPSGIKMNINTRKIYEVSHRVSMITGIPIPKHKAIVGDNAYSHASGIHQDGMLKEERTYQFIDPALIGAPKSKIVLNARSGKHALQVRLEEMGFKIHKMDMEQIYQRFIDLADSKHSITNDDLPALL